MRLLTDVARGSWLLERVGHSARVSGIAGGGFEAYARILHPVPVTRVDLTAPDEWGVHPVLQETRWPWSRVAGRVGAVMHPLVQWNRLVDVHQGVTFDDGWQVGQTREGYFDLDLLAALTAHLSVATTTPGDIVAGFWNGWGELTGAAHYVLEGRGPLTWLDRRRSRRRVETWAQHVLRPEVRAAAQDGPFLQWPDREMLLFATSTDELGDPTWVERAGIGVQPVLSEISPQLLWPADRSWVLASEIDWDSTIVAGPRALVDAVLADEQFEAFEVGQDDDLTYEGDTINPPRVD